LYFILGIHFIFFMSFGERVRKKFKLRDALIYLMVANVYFPYINEKYQDIIIDELIKFYNQGLEISNNFLKKTAINITPNRILQFVFMVVFQFAFGLTKSGTFSLLTSGRAEKVRAYIYQQNMSFPGGSTASKRMGQLFEACKRELMDLAGHFQDYFYVTVGKWARSTFAKEYHSTQRSMTSPPECFIGLIAPSKLFPHLDVIERGVILPFFNALIYKHAKRISSTAELIGALKTPSFDGGIMIFLLAEKFGFFGGPPGKNALYSYFRTLEKIAEEYNTLLNEKLAELEIFDLSVVSVDTTNVPVDKRDKTGSIGKGSRGTFFGHKSSIACDAQCIPINSILDTGRCSDKKMFPDTINPVKNIATHPGQETWCMVSDAAYSEISVISQVESMNVIPIIDINPKNSVLLKELKEKGSNLLEFTRKAIKSASRELKIKLRAALRLISKKRGFRISLKEKKSILRAMTKIVGQQILSQGLIPKELQIVEQFRREILVIRRKIRRIGTPYEKKVGLTALIYGTIEWLLIYSIRGQNEGINGLFKKRGDLIGDGQHTSWLIGQSSLSNRQMMDNVGIKYIACVKFIVTGQTDHFLRTIHNWRHEQRFFCFVLLVIICR